MTESVDDVIEECVDASLCMWYCTTESMNELPQRCTQDGSWVCLVGMLKMTSADSAELYDEWSYVELSLGGVALPDDVHRMYCAVMGVYESPGRLMCFRVQQLVTMTEILGYLYLRACKQCTLPDSSQADDERQRRRRRRKHSHAAPLEAAPQALPPPQHTDEMVSCMRALLTAIKQSGGSATANAIAALIAKRGFGLMGDRALECLVEEEKIKYDMTQDLYSTK
jgi:hypothetical protein